MNDSKVFTIRLDPQDQKMLDKVSDWHKLYGNRNRDPKHMQQTYSYGKFEKGTVIKRLIDREYKRVLQIEVDEHNAQKKAAEKKTPAVKKAASKKVPAHLKPLTAKK